MHLHCLRELNVIPCHLLHLALQLVPCFEQLITLGHQAADCVLLVDAQASTLLYQVAKIGDFNLEVVNRFFGSLLLLMGSLYHLPGSFNLPLEILYRSLVLFGEVQGGLHFGCVGHNLSIQLSTLLD